MKGRVMPTIDADVAGLVARAVEHARAKAPVHPDWLDAFGYDRENIRFLGDGWYQIGHLQRRDDQLHAYPIVYNPTSRRLRVKLP